MKKLNHSGNNQLENAVFQIRIHISTQFKAPDLYSEPPGGRQTLHHILYIFGIFHNTFLQFLLSAKEPSPTVHCVLCGLNVTSQSEGKKSMDRSW